jgi:NAD(P)H-nitrite reductase large subunit
VRVIAAQDVAHPTYILQVLEAACHAVIIGGGLVGLEMADECRKSDGPVFLSQLCNSFVTMSVIINQYSVDRSRFPEEVVLTLDLCRRR